jgi:hypothetical protein
MITVLYVNHAHSEVCGVHDMGRRHARIIASADDIDLDYVEINSMHAYDQAMAARDYDVAIINFMPGIMPWVNDAIKRHSAVRIAVIHNYQHDTIEQVAAQHHRVFDFVLALDPTLETTNPWVLTTDRPLPSTVPLALLADHPIRVGTFGFAFPHKNFPAVATEIADTLDEAVFDLHMPEAFFNGANGAQLYSDGILAAVKHALRDKPGIEIHYTNDHLSPEALVARLADNHVNCLFYVPGQHNAGLSSALDYLIAARRPIMVTDCAMFAHYSEAVAIYPQVRLREVLDAQAHWSAAVTRTYFAARERVAEQTADHLRRVA